MASSGDEQPKRQDSEQELSQAETNAEWEDATVVESVGSESHELDTLMAEDASVASPNSDADEAGEAPSDELPSDELPSDELPRDGAASEALADDEPWEPADDELADDELADDELADDELADDELADDEPWEPEDETPWEPAAIPPHGATSSLTQRRASAAQHRAKRRRRRYIFYVRRMSRTRQAARSVTIARAAWVSAVALAVVVITAFSATLGLASSYYQSQSANISALSHTVASKDSMRIYDSHGTLLYELRNDGAQHSISLAQMPIDVINATVAIEDHTFWINQGIDFNSIARAAVADLNQGSIEQGASTITQQLIKQNVLNSNETFDRKLREAILAVGMTTQGVYTKREILQMYLDSIPYGQEAYGIDAAAQAYFNYTDDTATGMTGAQHLNLAQAAMLAGIPQNPNQNNPLLHPKAAHARQKAVLDAMVEYGYITQKQADEAYAEAGKPNFFNPQRQVQNLAPHFVTFVQNQIDNMIASGQLNLSRSGLNVYTTLDLDMQNHVQQAMKNHLFGNDRDDYCCLIRNDNVTNSAAMIADHHDGAIKVMLGSVDYNSKKIDGVYNVATQGYRGPGSSFKPLVYSMAFEKGWFPAMTVSDTPTVFWDQGASQPYKVLDFNPLKFFNTVTLRQALQYSLNIPAVKVMQYVGIPDAKIQAQRFGIKSWDPRSTWGLSSVLGSLDVHLYDMVQAYTVFANYGQYIPLHAINTITDSSENVLYQYHVPQPIQVISPQIAYMITSILSDNPSRIGEFGPCSPLYLDEKADCMAHGGNSPNARPAAAKTGTGQDFTDDWTMGYTMDYTMGVWVGNNNHSPMNNIDGVTGAAPIWYAGMMYANRNLSKTPFPVPSGMQRAKWTSDGITSTDWFLAGPLPQSNIGNGTPSTAPCIHLTNNNTDPWVYCAAQPAATPPSGGGGGGGNGHHHG